MSFDHGKETIREKHHLVDFPTRFIDNVIHQFHQKLTDKQTKYEMIIPDFLLAEPKKFILVGIPFSISNEKAVKKLLDNLQSFFYHKLNIAIKWSTKKTRSLFRLKDKSPQPASKIYEGICSWSANYIGETKRNVETWWNEHENQSKDSEPA